MFFCLYLQYLIFLLSYLTCEIVLFSGKAFWLGAGMNGTVEGKAKLYCSNIVKQIRERLSSTWHVGWPWTGGQVLRAPPHSTTTPMRDVSRAIVPLGSLFLHWQGEQTAGGLQDRFPP